MWYYNADHPLRRYFSGVTEQTFAGNLGIADPPLIDYLGLLLSRFIPFVEKNYPVKADLDAADARVDDFDAVVIPGGYAPDLMRRSAEMVKFVADMDAAGKTVAAICHAGWMLVSAKVVKGRRATCFYSVRDDLEAAGADWVDEPVVVDGNLITSRVPADLPDFCRAVIGSLSPTPAAVG